jgi:hypothetical protein
MSIEDRVRTATLAGASLIRDVRPLGAPAPVRLRRRPGPAPHRWVNWAVPLAAAAAVAAIALTLVAIRQTGTPSPAASGSGTAAPATVPRYYATGAFDSPPGHYGPLIVGDDLTGKVIDTVSPPHGFVFTNVRGTFDDRTFVVQAAVNEVNTVPLGSPPYTWYLLRIAPGGAHPYQLTKLPISLPGNVSFAEAYALSPDGRELAVESDGSTGKVAMGIYSVSTGAQLRAWTGPIQITEELAVRTLSWLYGGRRLVFSASTAGSAHYLQLRTLDVKGAGTDLMAGSQALLTADNPATSRCVSLQITPDGETAICATRAGSPGDPSGNAGCANGALRFMAFPLPADPSGKLARVLYQYPGACHDGTSSSLWTDPSASSIIGVTQINEGGKESYRVGVITGGRFRPLNIAKIVSPGIYMDLAF